MEENISQTPTPQQLIQQNSNVQIPPSSKSKRKFVIIGIVIASLLLIAGISFATYQYVKKPKNQNTQTQKKKNKQISQTLSTSSPVDLSKIKSGKITYIQNGNLFIADKKGKRQITSNTAIETYKWSRDGRYLGWIVTSGIAKSGVALYILDTTSSTNNPKKIVSVNENDLHHDDTRIYEIQDFDFSPDDKQIVYTRGGVWISDINGENPVQIEKDIDNPNPFAVIAYGATDWNPKNGNLLLLSKSGNSEFCSFDEIYNLTNKTVQDTNDYCGGGEWSADGQNIISYSGTSVMAGGVWVTPISTLKTQNIYNLKELGGLSEPVFDNNNNMYVIIGYGLVTNEYGKQTAPYNGADNIFHLLADGTLKPVTTSSTAHDRKISLSFLPSLNQFAYMTVFHEGKSSNQTTYSLHTINLDGTNNQSIFDDITSYKWFD